MAKKRKKYSAKMKFQVVMELVNKHKTQAQITSEYWVWATQQVKWKKQFLEEWSKIFEDKRLKKTRESDHQKKLDDLHKKIGQLSVERDWLQKKIGMFPDI